MRLTAPHITTPHITTSLVACAALAVGALSASAGTAAGQQLPRSPVASSSVTTDVSPGDLRVWESTHADTGLASRILPGDVRV